MSALKTGTHQGARFFQKSALARLTSWTLVTDLAGRACTEPARRSAQGRYWKNRRPPAGAGSGPGVATRLDRGKRGVKPRLGRFEQEYCSPAWQVTSEHLYHDGRSIPARACRILSHALRWRARIYKWCHPATDATQQNLGRSHPIYRKLHRLSATAQGERAPGKQKRPSRTRRGLSARRIPSNDSSACRSGGSDASSARDRR